MQCEEQCSYVGEGEAQCLAHWNYALEFLVWVSDPSLGAWAMAPSGSWEADTFLFQISLQLSPAVTSRSASANLC